MLHPAASPMRAAITGWRWRSRSRPSARDSRRPSTAPTRSRFPIPVLRDAGTARHEDASLQVKADKSISSGSWPQARRPSRGRSRRRLGWRAVDIDETVERARTPAGRRDLRQARGALFPDGRTRRPRRAARCPPRGGGDRRRHLRRSAEPGGDQRRRRSRSGSTCRSIARWRGCRPTAGGRWRRSRRVRAPVSSRVARRTSRRTSGSTRPRAARRARRAAGRLARSVGDWPANDHRCATSF